MSKIRITVLIIILHFLLFCPHLRASSLSGPAEENAGFALLDAVFVTFKELAEMREPIMEKTDKALSNMMQDAKKARDQSQVDEIFFKRFHRILLVLKIVITPIENDPGDILGPFYFRELNRFIEDVEGIKYDVKKAGSSEAIETFSKAISHEIIDLRIYLETKERREKLLEEYEKQISLRQTNKSVTTDQSKQLKSLREITFINRAMTDYLTDHGSPPSQSGTFASGDRFHKALSPFYIKILPANDAWESRYRVYSGESCNGVYDGIEGCTAKDILIVSYGRDGKKENWSYNPKKPEAGLYVLESDTAYDKDLVIWNGNWIRAPQIVKKRPY